MRFILPVHRTFNTQNQDSKIRLKVSLNPFPDCSEESFTRNFQTQTLAASGKAPLVSCCLGPRILFKILGNKQAQENRDWH